MMHGKNKVAKVRTERRFDNANLRCGGIKTCECAPVIDNQPSTDYIGTSIHSASLRKGGHQARRTRKREKKEKKKRRTTSGTCSRLDNSSWSWVEVFGWTRPP